MIDTDSRERARALTLRYTVASSAIFLASGVLGVLLRDSQADLGRLDPNTFYAIMTAHGLAAFVGWGAFAVMGFAWWVLAEVGFPLRRFGVAMAEATFWLMMIGAVGVLVTTLALDFAGSWVFLYPLPFSSAGEWGDLAAGIFSASVLLVGVSILTWCAGILHTVVGPALHAVSPSLANRLGLTVGFGYVAPKRFATNPTPVPYPVIPLAVIALGMIVATLPMAALLVEMIVQSIEPGVSVDPLLAKNALWFFGHPVVYLLLFPAAAIYYLLIPRFAGRPLVAGNVVAIAWAIALVANVTVWAHHIYLDYPEGTVQAALNTAMQPVTFALTLPSALSLYSLAFTIFRSNFQWNAASTALFLGLVGWLLAGLSGVINATIAADVVVHNTLWIVGHFHHMAFLNIGLAIFGAVYAFLPGLCGKKLWSEAAARWHVWLTFLAGTAVFTIWLIQGLQGAPRRFAVLPERWDALTQAAIPFVFVLALAQILFAWNLVQTLRGAGERVPRARRVLHPAVVEARLVLAVLAVAFAGGIVGLSVWLAGEADRAAGPPTVTAPSPPAPTAPGPPAPTAPAPPAPGEQVFADAGCGNCHTLAAAGASGQIGPNLDQVQLDVEAIVQVVAEGRGGMPASAGQLSDREIADVAAFVAESAGR